MSAPVSPKRGPVCPECGSAEITVYAGTKTNGIMDGRLQSHDVQPTVFAGCDECSETLWTVNADSLVARLDVADVHAAAMEVGQ